MGTLQILDIGFFENVYSEPNNLKCSYTLFNMLFFLKKMRYLKFKQLYGNKKKKTN